MDEIKTVVMQNRARL